MRPRAAGARTVPAGGAGGLGAAGAGGTRWPGWRRRRAGWRRAGGSALAPAGWREAGRRRRHSRWFDQRRQRRRQGVGAGQGDVGGTERALSARLAALGAFHVGNRQKSRRDRQTAPRRAGTDREKTSLAMQSGAPAAPGGHSTGEGDRKPVATTLDGVLTALRRRALGDSALHWALLALAGWAAAVSVVLIYSKVTPTAHVTLIVGGLAFLAVLMAIGAWALGRPTVVQVARVADARLDLNERLASALFYAHAQGEIEGRLRADAVGAASRYKPAQAFPLRRHRDLLAVALLIALVGVVLAITPNPQSAALSRQAANREATAQARHVVASARHELGRPTSAEAQKIAGALQATLSELAKAGTPLASLVALSNLSRQLAQLDNSSGAVNQAADAAAGDALAGAPGAQHAASALASGNLKAAATNLRSLAGRLSTLSQPQRKALAAALGKAAAAAGYQARSGRGASGQSGTNGQFAGGLAQASSALSGGNLGSAGQVLKSAAGAARASAAAASVDQQLAADQAAIQNEEARVASQAQSGAAGGTKPGQGQPGAGQGGAGLQHSQGSAPGAGGAGNGVPAGGPGRTPGGAGSSGAGTAGGGGGSQGSGGGSGSGQGGAGSGNGSGPGPGGNGQGGEGGPGKAKPPEAAHGTKSGAAASPSDQVFIAGQPGTSAQVVGAQAGTGADVKTTPYQKVLPTFEKTALQGLGSHVVSPADQGAVRSYFSSLGSGG